jgi:hypothetical protein
VAITTAGLRLRLVVIAGVLLLPDVFVIRMRWFLNHVFLLQNLGSVPGTALKISDAAVGLGARQRRIECFARLARQDAQPLRLLGSHCLARCDAAGRAVSVRRRA